MKHPLSAGVYDALLEVMLRKNLRIKIVFYDTLEEGGCLHRSGHFISDGKKLDYAPKGSKKETEWVNRQLGTKGVLTKYEGPGGNVVIESGYTGIGMFVFRFRHDLTSVVIPESVKKIGDSAFEDCKNLKNVTPPPKTALKDSVFRRTPWLETLGEYAVVNSVLAAYHGPGGGIVIPKDVKT